MEKTRLILGYRKGRRYSNTEKGQVLTGNIHPKQIVYFINLGFIGGTLNVLKNSLKVYEVEVYSQAL